MKERIFEIKTLKAVIIKNIFEVIKPYIKETSILINQDGMKISTMDLAKTSVTHIKLHAKKFESYVCEKSVMISFDTSTFFKTLKTANRRDTITFYMNKNEEEKLGIELSDPYQGKIKDYKIPLLAVEPNLINVKDIDYEYSINMPSAQFQQIIKDIQLLEGKIVEIKSIGKQLVFSCQDGIAEFETSIIEIDDTLNKDQKALLQQNGEDIRSIKFQKSNDKIVQGRFKMDKLLNFIKASHLCDNMNIYLTNDKPLLLEYPAADLGVIKFLLMNYVD